MLNLDKMSSEIKPQVVNNFQNRRSSVSFTNAANIENAAKTVEKLTQSKLAASLKNEGLIGKLLGIFYKSNPETGGGGEVQSIIVNAIGTAVFAPLLIFFNPLSKEPKDNREYSAWRQPISAAIAVVTGVLVNMQFGKSLYKFVCNTKHPDYDLSSKPPKEFLVAELKKGVKNNNIKEVLDRFKFSDKELESILGKVKLKPADLDNITGKIDPKTFWEEFADAIHGKLKEREVAKIAEILRFADTHGDNLLSDKNLLKQIINRAEGSELVYKQAQEIVKQQGFEIPQNGRHINVKSKPLSPKSNIQKQLRDYYRHLELSEKLDLNGALSKLRQEIRKGKISSSAELKNFTPIEAFIQGLAKKVRTYAERITHAGDKSNDTLRNKRDDLVKTVKEMLKKANQDYPNKIPKKEIQKIVDYAAKEINENNLVYETVDELINDLFKPNKSLRSDEQRKTFRVMITDLLEGKFLEAKYDSSKELTTLQKKTADEIRIALFNDIKEGVSSKANKGIKSVKGLLSNGTNIIRNKLAEAIYDFRITRISKHFNTAKTWGGFGLTFITLIPACYILNWAHPRFIEVVFPRLAKDKTGPKGGNK